MGTEKTMKAYAMAGARQYHIAADDWVASGKAICGADIARPGWTIPDIGKPASIKPLMGKLIKVRCCGKCAKQANVKVEE